MPPTEPPEPATVQNFLNDVAACTFNTNHIETVSGAPRWFHIVRHVGWDEGEWALTANSLGSYTLTQATYDLLVAGTAGQDASGAPDGSFWSGGVRYWLQNVQSTLVATPVLA